MHGLVIVLIGNDNGGRKAVALIADAYLNQLRKVGLHVSYPIPAFAMGVWVCKPKAVQGHNIPGYKTGYVTIDDDGPQCPDEIDAPMLKLMCLENIWRVDGQDCAGGMGPADFINEWSTPEEAINDILDFYFGDPTRMARKVAEEEKFRARLESSSGR
jgi:hypothetical protein